MQRSTNNKSRMYRLRGANHVVSRSVHSMPCNVTKYWEIELFAGSINILLTLCVYFREKVQLIHHRGNDDNGKYNLHSIYLHNESRLFILCKVRDGLDVI